MIGRFFIETWRILNEMSFYLLFGFLIAGILKILIPEEKIYRHLSSSNFPSILKATLIGIPLPLCSCGVIPVSAHIKKEGASDSATISFLISTPTTGIDSIFATYSLLGTLFAIIRPVSAFLSGIFAGTIVNLTQKNKKILRPDREIECETCKKEFYKNKIKRIFTYGFYELIQDTGKWIILGIILGGFISSFVPERIITQYLGKPFYSYLTMLLIGIPMYVCATGSIPIVSSLISKGMAPGAGLVFLFTGPATNSATLSFVFGKLGKRNFLIYLFSIILWAVLFGILIDSIWKNYNLSTLHIHGARFIPNKLRIFSSYLLLFLILRTFKIKREKKDMKRYFVPDMKCSHCVRTIENALKDEGIENFYVNLRRKSVYVDEKVEEKKVFEVIEKAGYKVKKIERR